MRRGADYVAGLRDGRGDDLIDGDRWLDVQLVATLNDGTVLQVRPDAGTDRAVVVAKIPVGRRPWNMAITPDGKKLYVACGRSNAVAVIDTETNTKIAEIPVGELPWGVTVSSVEMRDVVIPGALQDAMSMQAQAERERQARDRDRRQAVGRRDPRRRRRAPPGSRARCAHGRTRKPDGHPVGPSRRRREHGASAT